MADHWIIGDEEVDRDGLRDIIARACDRALTAPSSDVLEICFHVRRGLGSDFPALADAIRRLMSDVEVHIAGMDRAAEIENAVAWVRAEAGAI